jgi:hypothetical protein
MVRNLDLLALLVMMIAIASPGLVLTNTPIARDTINGLDESWQIDLIYKATRGIWSGRDFAFTYGPLWQLLASILPRMAGVSLGSISKLLYLYNYWGAFLLAFITCRLLVVGEARWRRAVFLIGLVAYWLPMDLRPGLAVASFACYFRLTEDLPASRRSIAWRAAVATLLVVIAFLMAGDCGALSAAAWAAVVVGHAAAHWRDKSALKRLVHFVLYGAAFTTLWVALVNTWAARPWDFQYWIRSFQVITAYRWLMVAAMAPETGYRLMWTFLACMAIFLAAWLARDAKSETPTMRPAFIVAAVLFSAIALQKGVVRSGWGHVSQCMLPALSMAGVILVGYRNALRPYLANLTLLAFVALSVLASGPTGLLAGQKVAGRVMWNPPAYPACPPDTYYLDQACLLRTDYSKYGVASAYIASHTRAEDQIAVFPYENLLGILSHRTVSDGVLQNYAVGGKALTDLQISTLERDHPPLAVYNSDDLVSWPVDSISNFQRSAPIWFYLQSRYTAEAETATGVTIMHRDDARNGIRVENELWRGSKRSQANRVVVAIDPQRWQAADPDFLHLRLRIQYPPWLQILKPSAFKADVLYSNGTTRSINLMVQPNIDADVWIYPWEEIFLKDYFQSDPQKWRRSGVPRPAVTAIELWSARYDPLCATVRYIEVKSVTGTVLRTGQRQ